MNPGGLMQEIDASVIRIGFRKFTAIHAPPPTKALVFIDEHPASIEDPVFGISQPGEWWWINFPGTLHQMGANLSFADGHAEFWKWKEDRTSLFSKNLSWTGVWTTKPGDRDLSNLQECIPHIR